MTFSFDFGKKYQPDIEKGILQKMATLGTTTLAEACSYALQGGGKRFRPAIVYMIADALKLKRDVKEAALAIELFHTSSLIVDDLPCMDNENERRNRPTLHRVYGETTALLASYALIAAGYESIHLNSQELQNQGVLNADEICVLALQSATYNTGILGATGGQFLDLFPPQINVGALQDCIQKKTCSLFEIAFVFGWLFGGGDKKYLGDIKQAAHHFGFAFQIFDDMLDLEEDRKNGKKINFVDCFGEVKARAALGEHAHAYKSILKKLSIDCLDLSKPLEALL